MWSSQKKDVERAQEKPGECIDLEKILSIGCLAGFILKFSLRVS